MNKEKNKSLHLSYSNPLFLRKLSISLISACHGSMYTAIDPFLLDDWFTYLDDSFNTLRNIGRPWLFPFVLLIIESFALIFDTEIAIPPPCFEIKADYFNVSYIPSIESCSVDIKKHEDNYGNFNPELKSVGDAWM